MGYTGNEIRLAMDRKEVGGQCGLAWGTAKTRLTAWLAERKLTRLTQFGLTRASDLPDVPLAADFAKKANGTARRSSFWNRTPFSRGRSLRRQRRQRSL